MNSATQISRLTASLSALLDLADVGNAANDTERAVYEEALAALHEAGPAQAQWAQQSPLVFTYSARQHPTRPGCMIVEREAPTGKLDRWNNPCFIKDEICVCGAPDAQEILRAVNAHERLAANSKALADALNALLYAGQCDPRHRDRFEAMFAKACAVLADHALNS